MSIYVELVIMCTNNHCCFQVHLALPMESFGLHVPVLQMEICRLETSIKQLTIQRVLEEQRYHRRIAWKVPFLTQAWKHKRLEWAKEFEGVDKKEWMNLMLSDECMVEIDGKG